MRKLGVFFVVDERLAFFVAEQQADADFFHKFTCFPPYKKDAWGKKTKISQRLASVHISRNSLDFAMVIRDLVSDK